jgi:hypothetical protein
LHHHCRSVQTPWCQQRVKQCSSIGQTIRWCRQTREDQAHSLVECHLIQLPGWRLNRWQHTGYCLAEKRWSNPGCFLWFRVLSVDRGLWCGTESNAFIKSVYTTSILPPSFRIWACIHDFQQLCYTRTSAYKAVLVLINLFFSKWSIILCLMICFCSPSI